MAYQCKKCPYFIAVPPGEKPPPWCPRCGADLKIGEMPAPKAAPAAVSDGFLPKQAETATEVGSLGTLCETFEPQASVAVLEAAAPEEAPPISGELVFPGKLVWQIVGVLCALVSFGIVAIAISQLIHPPKGRSTPMGLYGVLGMFSIGGLVAVVITVYLRGQKYAVSPHHLTAWRFFKPATFRWDQIREVFQDAHPAWVKYRLVTRLGQNYTVAGEISNHKRLGELIAAQVAALKLPAALKELEGGHDLLFGPLRVSRGGVNIEGHFEPWHRIGALTFGLNPTPKRGNSLISNMMHVRIGSSLVELGEIPNYRLFESVAYRLFPKCLQPA